MCRKKFNLLSFAILAFTLSTSGAETLKSDKSRIDFSEKATSFILKSLNSDSSFNGEFTVSDGKSKQADKLLMGSLRSDGNVIDIKLLNPKYEWTISCKAREKLFLLECELANKTDEELWLEPGINIACELSGQDFFWGGFDVLPLKGKTLSRAGLKGRVAKHIGGGLNVPFPVSALIREDETVFIGHTFMDPVSYDAAKIQPESEKSANLSFSQRMVLAPRQKIKVNFILGITPTRYGREEGVVQAMYDAFPEAWTPLVGQENQYIWGTHSQYRSWYYKPDYEKERRYYSTIEWTYCPYKRSGDIYGKDELWNYKPERDFPITFGSHVNGGIFDYGKLTLPEFKEKRKAVFLKNAKDFGYAFYNTTSGTWCEIALAKEKYPDAINQDTDGGVQMIIDGWSTHHDKEIRVFPMGTSFSKVFRRDTEVLYKELDLPGFAFDCAAPGIYYRGPAVQNPDLPGRAWDEKGIFIDQSVAINNLVDFVHDMGTGKPDYEKPFVWANGTLKADLVMIETSIFNPVFASWMPLYRYNMGSRPGNVHGPGFMDLDLSIPEWRSMSKEVFMDKLGRIATHAVFTDFQYGITQSHVTQNGNPQSLYCMPELLEVARLGWQAQMPVDCNNKGKLLYKARYGKGENTVFYYGNPWDKKFDLKFDVNNEFLGKANYVFVRKMRDSASTDNHIKNGVTSFDESLPGRLPVLFEAVCGFSKLPEDISCTVSSLKDTDKIKFTVTFKDNPLFKTAIYPRQIRDFKLSSVKINSKNVATDDCAIPADAKIELEYKSNYFNVGASEILKFPFISDDKISFAICLPLDANQSELKEAGFFQEYFKFCFQNKIIKDSKLPEIINPEAVPKNKNTVSIFVGEKRAPEYPYGISVINNNTVIIKAANPKDARTMCNAVKYVMDRRFEYMPSFGAGYKMTSDVLNRFELNGKLLPFQRCFENLSGVKNEK